MTKGFPPSFVGLRSLVVDAKPRDEALVQVGPFRLGPDRTPCHQIHHLFHFSGTSLREAGPVKRDPCLCSFGCPPKVGFEMTSILKIGYVADSRKDGCCTRGTNR